jgi:hypothetical protein
MEKRLQIDFTEKAYSELEALQKRLDAKSKSEVIRDALGVLTWLTDEILKNNHVILVEKPEAGVTREVVFHFLERVRSQNHSDAAEDSRSTSSSAIAAQR